MSSKQMAAAVLSGRKVTFTFLSGADPIEGYLAGMDDFHWFVVTSTGVKHLIHKTTVYVTISDEDTYATEPQREALDKIVGPFRLFVRDSFSRNREEGGGSAPGPESVMEKAS